MITEEILEEIPEETESPELEPEEVLDEEILEEPEEISEEDSLITELRKELEQIYKELGECRDAHLRILAEYDNFRKRSQKEKENIYQVALADTLAGFLPVIDNFERALQQECADENYKKGFEMINSQFLILLENKGVKEIDALGKPFDPEFHNAVMKTEDENLGENIVAEVFQKGYTLGERVIRHSMVKVAN
ncbi:MAG: nucleotide exchange factor GrpE [Oscillospiraceae bacterium]|jgi:molecular chaperone GrpE|nr:nucleotide exchange factor GrpE [Oscillospiraceae bacterium]